HGILVAPNAFVQLPTGIEQFGHHGQLIAANVTVHQITDFFHHPFERDDCHVADPEGIGAAFGCKPRDTDGDSLSDCDEDTDGDDWTDKHVFNGARMRWADNCHENPTQADIDTVAEIEACLSQETIREEKNQYSGWNWSEPGSPNLCSPDYDFEPGWSVCGDAYQVDSRAVMRLEPGWNCFLIEAEPSQEFGGQLVAVVQGGELPASAHSIFCKETETTEIFPIRWFYESVGGPHDLLDVKFCHNSAFEACVPTQPLPSRRLRLPCEDDECALHCPCGDGAECDSDSDCEPGAVCGEGNGAYFGKPPSANVCWHKECETQRDDLCGATVDALCGACHPDCDHDSDCPSGEVCGLGAGAYVGRIGENA